MINLTTMAPATNVGLVLILMAFKFANSTHVLFILHDHHLRHIPKALNSHYHFRDKIDATKSTTYPAKKHHAP